MDNVKENIVGTRIGIYDVLCESGFKSNDRHKMYHVKCIYCGFETDMKKSDIKRPTKCLHITTNRVYVDYKFRWSNKKLKSIFHGMKKRCYNENDKNYKWYGAKGIKICDKWLENPNSFEEWALKNGYQDGLTIDRINEDKDYMPDNCRWITVEQNAKYKSTTSLINVNGEEHTGKDWAKILGLGVNRINTYIREYGLENTIEFIKRCMSNPSLKDEAKNRNIYSLYMN